MLYPLEAARGCFNRIFSALAAKVPNHIDG